MPSQSRRCALALLQLPIPERTRSVVAARTRSDGGPLSRPSGRRSARVLPSSRDQPQARRATKIGTRWHSIAKRLHGSHRPSERRTARLRPSRCGSRLSRPLHTGGPAATIRPRAGAPLRLALASAARRAAGRGPRGHRIRRGQTPRRAAARAYGTQSIRRASCRCRAPS
eukprot:716209-Prymnesium_polylepis.1